jgi:hypothetical protein
MRNPSQPVRAEGPTPGRLYQCNTILPRRGLPASNKASSDFVQMTGRPRSSRPVRAPGVAGRRTPGV